MTRQLMLIALGTFAAGFPVSLMAQSPESTYLLAATPFQDDQSAVYKRSPDGGMDLVRVITPAGTGVHSVLDSDGDAIAELYPPTIPTNITIIHKGDLNKVDDLVINPSSQFEIGRVTFLRLERPGGPVEALIGLAHAIDRTIRGVDIDVVKVKLDSTAPAEQRVTKGSYQDYVRLDMKGDIGGPTLGSGDFAYAQGGKLLYRVGRFGSTPSTLDSVPPSFNTGLEKESIQIVAASPDYMVLGKFRQAGDPDRSDLRVHDIRAGVWKNLSVPGLTSRHRLFGSWLASIIEHPRQPPPPPGSTIVIDPGTLSANPGHFNERAGDGRTLPNVQELFMAEEARFSIIPGILELNNLSDGRRIVIETRQEDSEVILVTADGIVLYRVNDSIFQARIEGSALSSPELFVKGERVPEVHWAFAGSN